MNKSVSNGLTQKKHLNSYMYDIGNLRSHHWKHWMDVYENCAFDCKYCVYRSGNKMGKIRSIVPSMELLEAELAEIENPGIVYLGPKADIYQPQDKRLELTRRVLAAFERHNISTFVVTRSELIERDLDILRAMATKGLVEVSVTIASARVQPALEPGTASIEKRLDMISMLAANGIPVSTHFSPIIPYLDDVEDLKDLMRMMTDRGASCIYACVLGMADRYYDVVRAALPDDAMSARIDRVYETGNRRLDIYSADQSYIFELMSDLTDFASKRALPFACVHIPEFDTVERSGHIFRQKLPNVGDIIRYFNRFGKKQVTLSDTIEFVNGFPAVDDAFRDTVRKFWNEGVLFRNTYFNPVDGRDGTMYERCDKLDLLVTNMRVDQGD